MPIAIHNNLVAYLVFYFLTHSKRYNKLKHPEIALVLTGESNSESKKLFKVISRKKKQFFCNNGVNLVIKPLQELLS